MPYRREQPGHDISSAPKVKKNLMAAKGRGPDTVAVLRTLCAMVLECGEGNGPCAHSQGMGFHHTGNNGAEPCSLHQHRAVAPRPEDGSRVRVRMRRWRIHPRTHATHGYGRRCRYLRRWAGARAGPLYRSHKP